MENTNLKLDYVKPTPNCMTGYGKTKKSIQINDAYTVFVQQ